MRLDRRELLWGSGALAAWLASPAGAKGVARAGNDGYSLSPANPAATRDQKELEELAIRLLDHPEVRAATSRTKAMWARAFDRSVSRELWSMFDDHVASYCFRSILMAANSDAAYPRVLRVYSPAGKWLGHQVPASKWGAENPDNCYRIIPVERGGRYRVDGRRQAEPPSHVSYQLVADTDTSITLGLIDQRDLDVAADGSFAITLDATPANGRKNHLQLPADARYLFIRDTMGDWRQTPNALRARRLDPPGRPPVTLDELAARAGRIMHTGVYFEVYNLRSARNAPMGVMSKPILSGAVGGLKTQVSSSGWLELAGDEAAVITADAVDATYASAVLYDFWHRSLEYRDHQSHLNSAMMAPDADGRFTYVVSATDPGVHNWLDTVGLHEVALGFRWQGLPGNVAAAPGIGSRIVKLADLATALPPGVRRITPAERARQLAERRALYDRRFIDN